MGSHQIILCLAHCFLISISKTIWFFWWVSCHFSEQPWDVLAFFEIDFVFNLLTLRDAFIYKYPLSPLASLLESPSHYCSDSIIAIALPFILALDFHGGLHHYFFFTRREAHGEWLGELPNETEKQKWYQMG